MTITELIKTGRVPICEEVTSLSQDYIPKSPFSVFLVPKSGSTYELGDVITFQAYMSGKNEAVKVPVVIGDWAPLVLRGIKANTINLGASGFELYTAPIDFGARYENAM